MYSSGHFPWEVYPRASWTPASTLHTWGFHLRSLKLDSSPGANRLWLGEKRQDWSGCFTARSTGFLGAEGLNVLNAGGRLEHRGDHAHTHFVSLSLIDTHSLTHSPCLSDNARSSDQYAECREKTQHRGDTQTHTATLPPQMSLAISAQIFVLNDQCPSATAVSKGKAMWGFLSLLYSTVR